MSWHDNVYVEMQFWGTDLLKLVINDNFVNWNACLETFQDKF